MFVDVPRLWHWNAAYRSCDPADAKNSTLAGMLTTICKYTLCRLDEIPANARPNASTPSKSEGVHVAGDPARHRVSVLVVSPMPSQCDNIWQSEQAGHRKQSDLYKKHRTRSDAITLEGTYNRRLPRRAII